MIGSLFRLVPAVLRHLDAYTEIAGADAKDAAAVLASRMLAALFAAAAALVSALMVCAWVLALTWDGPWRTWTAAGLAIAFAAVSAGLAIPLLRYFVMPRRWAGQRPLLFSRVRREWHRDRDLLERAMESGVGDKHAAG